MVVQVETATAPEQDTEAIVEPQVVTTEEMKENTVANIWKRLIVARTACM